MFSKATYVYNMTAVFSFLLPFYSFTISCFSFGVNLLSFWDISKTNFKSLRKFLYLGYLIKKLVIWPDTIDIF